MKYRLAIIAKVMVMYVAKGLNGMMLQTKENLWTELMARKDVPRHLVEAVYIMQGVFKRMSSASEKSVEQDEQIEWQE